VAVVLCVQWWFTGWFMAASDCVFLSGSLLAFGNDGGLYRFPHPMGLFDE